MTSRVASGWLASARAEHLAGVQLSSVRRSVPDLVEAAVLDEPWTDALVLRCQALLAADESAEDLYVASLATHPVGERRKADARHQLITARQLFDEIDARPWADRAAGELAAIDGSTRHRPTSAESSGLTPKELQIAELNGVLSP